MLRRLHFYAGILVAPFLLVAALSGFLYALAPQLDQVVYSRELSTEPGTTRLPVADQVKAAQAAVPGGELVSVTLPEGAEATTRVNFEGQSAYVDPYTGKVRGVLDTVDGNTPLTAWLADLHKNLHLGEPGRIYSELAASWLWVLVLGGLILWWRRNRRLAVRPEKGAKGVRRTRSWHASAGVWLTLGLLFLSATGLTWSTYAGENFQQALTSLSATPPKLNTTLPSAPAAAAPAGEHAGHGMSAGVSTINGDIDAILTTARDEGLSGPVEITLAGPGKAWVVAQTDKTWPVRLDKAAIDPATATMTSRASWDDRPLLSKLSNLGIHAHMGNLFGLANQVVLAAIALGLVFVIIFGYLMWWQRRPTRADRRAPLGAAPARGGWRDLHPAVITLVPLVIAAVGWAIPLLGISLAAFLAIDLLAGLRTRLRRS
ncbi:PepSY-associated TM helix domain-containing protein [Longispora albida]|uniref:PepSY-associated TM helix domain-containing protein n=1 Tax=Longispora albida TaxID=203523 RepID=UPI000370CF2D|nr:PepSY domain-containing protein [Longispora albida]